MSNDGSDNVEVEFNADVEGYVIDEETTHFTTVVNLKKDKSHTLNFVKEDAEPKQTNLSITLAEQESGGPIEGVKV